MRRPKTTDAIEILQRRYIGEDAKRAASLEEERVNAQLARTIRELREDAGLTQKELAELIETTQSVISRLEDADYEGHSMSMLNRIARALKRRLTVSAAPGRTEETRSPGTSPVSVVANRSSIQNTLRDLAEWSEELHLAFAWASSARGTAGHWQLLPSGKIKRAVLGVQFARTEPFVLRELLKLGVLRVMQDGAQGVFHPKVIVGVRGNEALAIVGSSNFTRGGFDFNTELNLQLSGRVDAEPVASVLRFIDEQWHDPRASEPSSDWIDKYEKLYRSRPKPSHVLGPLSPTIINTSNDLDVRWSEFARIITSQDISSQDGRVPVFDNSEENSYLQEVEACQEAFRKFRLFESMPLDERKRVAGWGPSKGWFGSMRAAGKFMNITKDSPHELSIALDSVPPDGYVTLANAKDYLEAATAINGVALGAATRLLTMKRPDRFISANNASLQKMSHVYGIRADGIDEYLRVIEDTWKFPWASAPEPAYARAQRLWRARVALLDAIFYEHRADA